MPTELSTNAVELSTYQVTFSFTDEAGTAVTPNALTWTLTAADGTVINSRSSVAVPGGDLAASVTITLSGNDLSLPAGLGRTRHLTVVGTYDSDAGTDLPILDVAIFDVINLVYND